MLIEDLIKNEIERNPDEGTKEFLGHILTTILRLRTKLSAAEKRSDILRKLESAGVDNWEGYSEAFADEEDEEDEVEEL